MWIVQGAWITVIISVLVAWHFQGEIAAANKAGIGAVFLLLVHLAYWLYTKAKGGAKKLADAIPKKTHIDDSIYDQVAAELSSNQIHAGLMARAIAEADGDKDRTQAIYIKLRAAAIAAEREQVQQGGSDSKEFTDALKTVDAREQFVKSMVRTDLKDKYDEKLSKVLTGIFIALVFGAGIYALLFADSSTSKIANQPQQLQHEYTELAKAHPDFEKIANDPAFHEWVKTQPAGVQRLYESTSAQDNIVLLNMYKRTRSN